MYCLRKEAFCIGLGTAWYTADMKKQIILILALCGLLLIAVYATRSRTAVVPPTNTPLGSPTFSWQYTPIDNQDFPKTRITLTATYPDSTTISKEIDTPDGSCNDYSNPDTDTYSQSTMIICYAAGLGHYYKVVEQDDVYLVMRKTFEEGSPEYNPPQQQFETIARF